MNGLSCQVSFTKRQPVRSQYRNSNPSWIGKQLISCDASWTLSPHSLDLRKLSLHRSTHINNLISALILVNLNVLGLDLLQGDRSFFSLSGLLGDSGLLHFDCVDEVFCEFLNYLVLVVVRQSMFVIKACHDNLGLVFVLVMSRGARLSGHPRPSSVEALCDKAPAQFLWSLES